MTTAFTVAYEVSAPQGGKAWEGAVHRGVGESLVQLGTDEKLQRWLLDKRRGVEAASQALAAAALQGPRQHVVTAALAGLMFERAGRDLLEVPPPNDRELELPAVAVFREVMQKNASVCLEHARLSYAACAENARALKGLAHWSPFCAARSKRLPESLDPLP